MYLNKFDILAAVSAVFTFITNTGTGEFTPFGNDENLLLTENTATWYQPNGGFGACGAPSENSDFVVALSPSEYAGGANCWRHIGVRYQGKFVDVTVVDKCPGCEPGHIDLSEGAFKQLAGLDVGLLHGVEYNYE